MVQDPRSKEQKTLSRDLEPRGTGRDDADDDNGDSGGGSSIRRVATIDDQPVFARDGESTQDAVRRFRREERSGELQTQTREFGAPDMAGEASKDLESQTPTRTPTPSQTDLSQGLEQDVLLRRAQQQTLRAQSELQPAQAQTLSQRVAQLTGSDTAAAAVRNIDFLSQAPEIPDDTAGFEEALEQVPSFEEQKNRLEEELGQSITDERARNILDERRRQQRREAQRAVATEVGGGLARTAAEPVLLATSSEFRRARARQTRDVLQRAVDISPPEDLRTPAERAAFLAPQIAAEAGVAPGLRGASAATDIARIQRRNAGFLVRSARTEGRILGARIRRLLPGEPDVETRSGRILGTTDPDGQTRLPVSPNDVQGEIRPTPFDIGTGRPLPFTRTTRQALEDPSSTKITRTTPATRQTTRRSTGETSADVEVRLPGTDSQTPRLRGGVPTRPRPQQTLGRGERRFVLTPSGRVRRVEAEFLQDVLSEPGFEALTTRRGLRTPRGAGRRIQEEFQTTLRGLEQSRGGRARLRRPTRRNEGVLTQPLIDFDLRRTRRRGVEIDPDTARTPVPPKRSRLQSPFGLFSVQSQTLDEGLEQNLSSVEDVETPGVREDLETASIIDVDVAQTTDTTQQQRQRGQPTTSLRGLRRLRSRRTRNRGRLRPIPTPKKNEDGELDVEGLPKRAEVLVKRRGEFQRLNTGGSLNTEQAISAGFQAVDNTAARTFKLVKSDRAPSRQRFGEFNAAALRRSKSEPNSIVERTEFAIDTPGEKQEITPTTGLSGGSINL